MLGSVGGRKTLLVFVSATCSSCKDLAPALRSIARSERATTDTILISSGTSKGVREFIHQNRLGNLPTVVSSDLQQEYKVNGTPYGVLVDESGSVRAKGIVNSLEHLESLIYAGESGLDSVESLLEERALEGVPISSTSEGVGVDGHSRE